MEYIPTRIYIKLTDEESRALYALAQQERRDPREQAALLVRQQLELVRMASALSLLDLAVLTQVAKDAGLGSVEEAMGLVISEWVRFKAEGVALPLEG